MAVFKKIVVLLLLLSIFPRTYSLFTFATSVDIGNISAKSACLIDAESGRILYSKSSTVRMPMASTTKIMTALVALESGVPLDKMIKIPLEAVGVEGSSAYLRKNESVTLEILLYALMLSSANDAAVAIAIEVSNSLDSFVDLMNQKARSLGLKDTHFTNPHGLFSDDHYTTANDLAKLMAHAMKNPDFAKITACSQKAFLRDDGTSFLFTNHNRLLKSYDGVIGGKTGFTKKSGRCLVTCAQKDGLTLIAVTLNAPNDWNDHAKLYDFGFCTYERHSFNAESFKIPVICGSKSEINAASNGISLTLPKQHGEISIKINAPNFLFAEVKKGEKIGEIAYYSNGRIIATSPLLACEDVARIEYKFNLFDWLRDLLKRIF